MAGRSIQDALDEAVRSLARHDHRSAGSGKPLAPIALGLSVLAIVAAGFALAALAAAAAALVLYFELGRYDFADFVSDARLDWPLQVRLFAFAVSAVYAGVALATLAAARRRGGRSWAGLLAAGPARWRPRGAIPIALGTLAFAVAVTLIQVAGSNRQLLHTGRTDVVLLVTLAAKVVILAPLAEELLFRGWIYTALRAHWRVVPSVLTTAAAFVAIHWDADHRHMLGVLPLALALGVLREIGGGIRPTIALHAAYNFVIVAITLAAG